MRPFDEKGRAHFVGSWKLHVCGGLNSREERIIVPPWINMQHPTKSGEIDTSRTFSGSDKHFNQLQLIMCTDCRVQDIKINVIRLVLSGFI